MVPSGSEALLLQLYYHIVLPRGVPRKEDTGLDQIESQLAARLTDALKALMQHAPLGDHAYLDAARLALSTCRALNAGRYIQKDLLIKELQQLDAQQALILHISEQNAALLIYQHVT